MRDARLIFAGAVTVHNAFAYGVEGFPRDACGVVDTRLLGLGVAASRLALFDDVAARLAQAGVDLVKLLLALRLDTQMVEAGFAPSGRNGEVHARIVKHPLRVICLQNSRLGSEQGRVEAYGLREVADGDMHV